MKFFPAGGTGCIGQSLARLLLGGGGNVAVLVRRPESPQAQALRNMGALLATGDVTERESMRASMNGAEIVLHAAGQYDYGVDSAGKQLLSNFSGPTSQGQVHTVRL